VRATVEGGVVRVLEQGRSRQRGQVIPRYDEDGSFLPPTRNRV